MKNKILIIFFTFLIVVSLFSMNTSANELEDFHVGVFGASLLTGLRQTGGVINNNNYDESVNDISFTFSIIGLIDKSIDYVYSDFLDELEPNQAYLFSTRSINGFGPVFISLNASTSNSGFAEESIIGFQIGPVTIAKTYMLAWI
jgi:hypothetical protein